MSKKKATLRMGIAGKLSLVICAAALVAFLLVNLVMPWAMIVFLREEVIGNKEMRNHQVMSQIDLVLSNVNNIALQIRTDRALENLVRGYVGNPSTQALRDIQQFLQQYVVGNYSLLHTVLLHLDSGDVVSSGNLSKAEQALTGQEWYKSYRQKQQEGASRYGYSPVFSDDYKDSQGRILSRQTSMAIAVPYLGPQGTKGSIIMVCNVASIIQTSTYPLEIEKENFLLLDAENHPFYPIDVQDTTIQSEDISLLLEMPRYGRSNRMEGGNGYTLIEFSRHGDLKLVTKSTWVEMLAPFSNIFAFINAFLVVTMLITLAATIPAINGLLRPLRTLTASMAKARGDQAPFPLKVCSHDEVEDLANSFNSMSERLADYFKQLKAGEEERIKLNLLLINAQISPHFIYNTMSTITYLAKCGRNEDVIRVNHHLINILRDRLCLTDINVHCPLEEEIGIIKQYEVIQTYRYGPVFSIQWEVREEDKAVLVPKYILQPLIENALFHGLLPNKEANGDVVGGIIQVLLDRDGDKITITVADNGRGLGDKQLQEVKEMLSGEKSCHGLGLKNVATRLALFYGDESGIRILREDGWTKLILHYKIKIW